VWNAHVKGRPRLQADGTFGVDVVLITSQTLQSSRGNWIFESDWHTVIADEAHDFLRGQQTTQSHTLKMWCLLQRQTTSMFILTGTPFMTKITHDFVAITKAVALNSKRGSWSPDCTDEGLSKLIQGWVGVADRRYQREEERQLTIRRKMTETLAIFTIRRDEKSVVHGKKVMKDFLNSCHNIEDPLRPGDNGAEVREQDSIYADWRGQSGTRLTQQRNDDMRCLCFSYRFVQWVHCSNDTDRARIWDSYSLAEAQSQIRTRALVGELRLAKATGNKIIIYVQRRFQAELVLKVRTSHTLANIYKDLPASSIICGIYRRTSNDHSRAEIFRRNASSDDRTMPCRSLGCRSVFCTVGQERLQFTRHELDGVAGLDREIHGRSPMQGYYLSR